VNLDLRLPEGARLVTVADDPGLPAPMSAHNVVVWPEFLLHDPVANTLWDYLWSDFPEYQLALLDSDDAIMAAANSAPLSWDGTDAGLPSGWDDQFERTMAGHHAGTAPNTLGALQIVVAPGRQGQGLSAVMVDAFRALARARGFGAVIACVRPTLKHRYPLMSMSDYAAWQREDGLPWDAWLRVHVRAGGRIVRVSPQSMTIDAPIAAWRTWTGQEFPVSGPYWVDRALEPVQVDITADRATYHDANVWVVHRL
jgi:GNAT superfamily N-acetyltransferase